jgi:cell division septum initiation protein DivIVA
MTDLDTRSPEFTIGIRGYDRAQVDEYINHLQRLVAEAEQRARSAEAEYAFDEHAAVGPRIAEIFALAEAEAREMRDRVSGQASSLAGEARAEAQAIVEAAERAAGELKKRVEREHVVMFAELEQERERIRGEVAVLERRKAEAVGELHRLRELLGEAAGIVGHTAEVNGRTRIPAQLTGPSDETVELPAVTINLD